MLNATAQKLGDITVLRCHGRIVIGDAYTMLRDAVLSQAANVLVDNVRAAICEPTRTQIVRVLSAGPLSVGELAAILGRSKSATSQHLRVLREGGMVAPSRRGRAPIRWGERS